MMVVADPVFIESRRPGRLNAPDETFLLQQTERIIHRLPRNSADLCADFLCQFIRCGVRPTRHGTQNSQALSSDGKAMLTKKR